MENISYSFTRYLEAKKTVDDRALHRPTWDALRRELADRRPIAPLRLLEVGAGIGTMLQRMVEWQLLSSASYTAIDLEPQNLLLARQRLATWGHLADAPPHSTLLKKENALISLEMEAIDISEFARRNAGQRAWDLLVAHAVLDLLDLPSTLPQLFSLLTSGGLFYFTINFDGLTLLEPALDPDLDERIMHLYHQTMDNRALHGVPSGDSRTGRHLFTRLQQSGAQVLQAGASDWVVFPQQGRYPADEAYFLHFIIHTIQSALSGHPELDAMQFAQWNARRHTQVERGELVYIAHQIDFFGKYPG